MSYDAELDPWRDALLGPHESPTEHPLSDAWPRLAAGELPPTEVAPLLDHATGCSRCFAALTVARSLREEEPAAVHPIEAARSATRHRGWIAALAAAAAFVAIVSLRRAEPPEPVYRGTATGPAPTSAEALPRDAMRLSWTPGPLGSRYDIVVHDERLVPIAEARDLTEATWMVPAGSLRALPSGSRVVWQVTVILPDGLELRLPTWHTMVAGPQ